MVRHHRARGLAVPLRMLVSARGPEELIYAAELGPETTPVFTRSAPPGVPVGRMTAAHVAPLLAEQPAGGGEAYVGGCNGYAERGTRRVWALAAVSGGGEGPATRLRRLSGSGGGEEVDMRTRVYGWRWRRNPLRRRSDVVEAWTVLVVAVLLSVVAPLVGVA